MPAALGGACLLVVSAPLWIPFAALADLVRGRRRLPLVRCGLFAVQYGVNLVVELVLAPLLWVAAGFGTRLAQPAWLRRHHELVMWSARLMVRRADQLLGLRVTADATDELFATGPVIVLSRHLSVVDSAVPPIVFDRVGFRGVGLFTDDMLADPAMDLVYQRAGHAFIDRSGGPEVLDTVAAMVDRLDEHAAATLFPEGRLFRPERLSRALERVAESDPERAARLAPLRHLLPPRPAGVLTLLAAAPDLDIVVLGHVGLETCASIPDVLGRAPLDVTVEVFGNRIERASVPTDPDDQERWLDDVWLDLDRRLGDRLAAR